MAKLRASHKRWAICQYYEPFIMGGDVWQWRRFEVDAVDVRLAKKFNGFLFYDETTKEYRVHELKTGGLLGVGKTIRKAVLESNKNINTTPDLKEQVKALGDTTHFEEVPAAEALHRIARGSRK